MDAFSLPWEGLKAWVCPPIGRIIETVRKITHSRGMRGVLVVPRWTSAAFWPFLCPDGTHLTECFRGGRSFHPFIIRGADAGEEFSLLKGWTAFAFLALEIRSEGNGRLQAGKEKMPEG